MAMKNVIRKKIEVEFNFLFCGLTLFPLLSFQIFDKQSVQASRWYSFQGFNELTIHVSSTKKNQWCRRFKLVNIPQEVTISLETKRRKMKIISQFAREMGIYRFTCTVYSITFLIIFNQRLLVRISHLLPNKEH